MAKKKASPTPASDNAEQIGDQSAENTPETQQIKFLRSHPGYAYWPGDKADLTAEHVARLVDGGFAELVTEAETDETED